MFAIMMKNKPKHLNLNHTKTLLLQNKGARIEEHSMPSSWHFTSLQFTSVGCTGFAFRHTHNAFGAARLTLVHSTDGN